MEHVQRKRTNHELIYAIGIEKSLQMNLMLMFLVTLVLCSCSKTETRGQTWTLQTGVSVLESKICDQTVLKDGLSVSKQANHYIVEVNETFTCEADLRSPWLTVAKEHKATLVLAPSTKGSGCECRGKVRVQISDRLELATHCIY
jgi:hypothetical protein